MKKKLIIGILLAMFLPFCVSAAKVDLSKYNSKNLKDTLAEENITADLGNYAENDKQITIYMFRGQGCSHCQDFLNYVATTLVPNYGNYFKLVSFETWNDSSNATLLKTISTFLGETASGVPYIVIGDKTFLGYSENSNTEIEAAITSLYNSKDRYDVFDEINKQDKKENETNTAPILIGTTIITAVGAIIVIIYINSVKKELISLYKKEI